MRNATLRIVSAARHVLLLLVVCLLGCSRSRPDIESPADSADGIRISTTAAEIAPTVPTDSTTETFDTHRFLLLAQRGPMLIEACVSVNGQAPSQNVAPAIEYTLRAADTNDDGISSWSELGQNKPFVGGLLLTETGPTESEELGAPPQTEFWSGEFDTNQNDVVDRAEILPFLTSFEANKLIVFNSGPSFHERQHFESTVLQVIDVDKDEQFSAAELQSLPTTIMRYDYNDDECITREELSSTRASSEMIDVMMISADVPSKYGPSGLMLYRDRAWIRNHFLLRQRYGVSGRVTSDTIGLGLFDVLNGNDDDQIDEDEMQALCSIPPHISIRVRFGSETEVTASSTIGSYLPSTKSSGQFRLAGLTIQCRAQDTGPKRPVLEQRRTATLGRQSITANRIQLTVHDHADAVFSLLDSSGDGRLNPREIRAASGRITACDTAGDGQIFVEEISPTMQFEVTRGGDVRALESAEPRPVLPPVRSEQVDWFVAMDTNSDGELSRREFLGTIQQFHALDKNNDDFLTGSEARDLPE